jgi:hypothetical protein
LPEFPDTDVITIYDDTVDLSDYTHKNILNEAYMDYVAAMDEDLYDAITYRRNFDMHLAGINYEDEYANISTGRINWQEIISNYEFLGTQYDVLDGKLPRARTKSLSILINT